MNREKMARLMQLSWEIQKRKQAISRSKALTAAWAIVLNEDVTVHYLVQKLNHHKPVKWQVYNQMGLFNK